MKIRPYTPEDAQEVLRIWYDASLISHDFVPAEFWEAERENIITIYVPLAETWVAEEAGRVVGFMALIQHVLGGLFVDPAHQGRGIGTALVTFAKARKGPLEVDVFTQNAGARSFYEKRGFRLRNETIHGPTGCPQLTMVMDQ
ncbi:GNAT family N-acetyltransferase [Desulfocurvibacter africanus]|uniref:GNAT family N-acetyltransferase n=1 Tax=Desulfocurvibacter africanus TaxID=873 RepID=UPI0003FA8F2E|nr:GNAT family N-acetyltransferase [Desulfocurvibacter africanus]